jgi:hypothetical protein
MSGKAGLGLTAILADRARSLERRQVQRRHGAECVLVCSKDERGGRGGPCGGDFWDGGWISAVE